MDRISYLPNDILCNILSYLPTKEAVSTSSLSRRWRHVWKDVQVLDIDDILFWSSRDPSLDSFVNAILAQRNADLYPIKKFRLKCKSFRVDPISTSLNAVIGPCLQELYLSLKVDVTLGMNLPKAIFTCTSLTSLVLKHDISMYYGPEFPDVYLPSLKNLELEIADMDNKLLSGCPVLENLKLILQHMTPEGYVYIPTIQMPQTLKSLTFEDYSTLCDEINHRVIDTPSLEYLHLKIVTSAFSELHVLVSHFPNMVEAYVDIQEDHSSIDIHGELVEHVCWVPMLLQALRETELLTLKRYTTMCLFSAPAFKFPEFHHLIYLELDVPFFNTNFLLNVLHSCHVLEALIIWIWEEFHIHIMDYNGPTPPTMVPSCVTSHLKSFEFIEYQDDADEREFIAYLLQGGLVLETVIIQLRSDLHPETKDNIVKGLSAIPRGSTTCQLNFIDQNPI
ncbi:putative FBD-associated F-box protein At5g56440 [Arachis stenosperma]|uniref:putative FBD-associated F-box protein At5g56440 n=1 Tax=Arachis stenosperma TaxID=217475 RepID=UPI0025AC56FC|nr:putative FBD-associated F-box protein At5g56440 [Arachis stenosperma]XP_057761782.1 putative FBD-associated F-box protein At5g56440 [Arachis stenosperma]XP_057761783.1 putative FBD-associated F-box protein At5g56440 [Arachis stenosperma]XP_057761784.1 putative FBD-associated F-box protein At5g56440 [Arachis stenosperma]XP_057761785.1 putative FBD-associated F-box protein At5g56440 [Arachis stenosperma]XP_057761786.1 putative FBD-associated F-box protein At5g56440 [Arachis stenosperma]XP_05